jgi:hypothetical protein
MHPKAIGSLADAVAPPKFIDGGTGLDLVGNLDDLLFDVSLLFHGVGDVCRFRGRSSTQLQPHHWGKLSSDFQIRSLGTAGTLPSHGSAPWVEKFEPPVWKKGQVRNENRM